MEDTAANVSHMLSIVREITVRCLLSPAEVVQLLSHAFATIYEHELYSPSWEGEDKLVQNHDLKSCTSPTNAMDSPR